MTVHTTGRTTFARSHPVLERALADAEAAGDAARAASVRSAISVLALSRLAERQVPIMSMSASKDGVSPVTSTALPAGATVTALPPDIVARAAEQTSNPALRDALAYALNSDDPVRIREVQSVIRIHHAKHGLLADKESLPEPLPPMSNLHGWLVIVLAVLGTVLLSAVIWRPWQFDRASVARTANSQKHTVVAIQPDIKGKQTP